MNVQWDGDEEPLKCLDCNHFRVCQWCEMADCNLGGFEGLSMSEDDKETMLEASIICTEFEPGIVEKINNAKKTETN